MQTILCNCDLPIQVVFCTKKKKEKLAEFENSHSKINYLWPQQSQKNPGEILYGLCNYNRIKCFFFFLQFLFATETQGLA